MCLYNRESVNYVKKYMEWEENRKRKEVVATENRKSKAVAAQVFITEVDKLPTVHLVYDGMNIKARVDSCAGRSIIGGRLAKKVAKYPSTNVAVVKGVCGTLIPIQHQARLSVEIVQKARLNFDALVMESCEEELLIGADVLHAAQCVMDFGAKTISFPLETGGTILLPYTCEPLSGMGKVEVSALAAQVDTIASPIVCVTKKSIMPGESSRFEQL